MKKQDLKELIKPLVKECIHEVLIEEGFLSTIVAEVAKGMQKNLIVESRSETSPLYESHDDAHMKKKMQDSRRQMNERRKHLSDSIGRDAYNGVNVFEGIEPLRQGGTPGSGPQPSSVLGEDPTDAGVDISSLLGDASQIWKAMK